MNNVLKRWYFWERVIVLFFKKHELIETLLLPWESFENLSNQFRNNLPSRSHGKDHALATASHSEKWMLGEEQAQLPQEERMAPRMQTHCLWEKGEASRGVTLQRFFP